MSYRLQVVIDCADPHGLADWWAETLGWAVESSDPAFIQRMIAAGHATEADTKLHRGERVWRDGAAVVHPDQDPLAPRLYFQGVPEAKTVKNRLHLDVRVGDDEPSLVVERLTERGARVLYQGSQGPHRWTTMADPEGNEFCVSG